MPFPYRNRKTGRITVFQRRLPSREKSPLWEPVKETEAAKAPETGKPGKPEK